MRRHRLLSLLCLLIVSVFALPAAAHGAGHRASRATTSTAACAAADVDVTGATLEKATDATLCLLNRERSQRGMKPLQLDPKLGRAARAHSQDMVKRQYFEHESQDGRTPFQRMLATRYVPKGASWTLGENIGWGTLDLAQPGALVKAWMDSPGHRANILNPRFREIGIGIVPGVPLHDEEGQPGATYTTDFGQHS
ncbi:CAP domain-containing protein [Conexibacter sp. CPCC 206217]|uniref:CAP domain-containing protein n=1 Tax=Conexibacter sp. CPCC 206217 TaxID=3064574 RepID=UPI002716BCBA|nr:CAP domain-containing protein [Conexibacter sp. CPCC 206217]MDO8212996.1 CAP domain-containing protein [Conexibacter sp. CPCC 206217]